jgi:Protein of unknown function (DUF3592)
MTISVVFVAAVVVFWLLKRAKLRRAHGWPTEIGHVDSTSVVLSSGGGQPGSAAYYAQVKYCYTVQGHTYSGALSHRFMLKGRADKWISQYANSSPLTVRYNPNKAQDSVLLDSDQAGAGRVSNGLDPMGKAR